MKPYLKALKVVNLVWLVLVFLILILAAIPVIPGTVVIKMPGAEGWTTTEVGGVINITGNVSVYNGGVFPLDDFFFFMMLNDQDGNQVANFASPVISLPAGPTTTFPVYFEFQNTEAATVDIQKLFFSRATFTGLVYFNANYIFQFNIQALIIGETSLGPFIKDYQIHTEQATVQEFDGNCLLDIPYDIFSTYLLFGQDLSISGTVSNATEELGDLSTAAPLGGAHSGNITMTLSTEAYQHLQGSPDTLFLNCMMSCGPYYWPQNMTMAWTPPSTENGTAGTVVLADADGYYGPPSPLIGSGG